MIQFLIQHLSTLLIYALKVIICSGSLYGCYYFFLRNRTWHEWNRFYLLLSTPASIIIPLIQIPLLPGIIQETVASSAAPLIISNGQFNETDILNASHSISLQEIAVYIYLFISTLIFISLATAFLRIVFIVINNPKQKSHQYSLIFSKEKNTPFSFFRFIFWNENINIHSHTGKTILHHELVHVRQLHSADKLFLQLIHIFFWFNPFFWLIRRETDAVHEFIADRCTADQPDAKHLSDIMLATAFSDNHALLTNHFYSSSIKRRLIMLSRSTVKHNPAIRWMFLPVVIILFGAFTITRKHLPQSSAEKIFTVVVDAGHGGSDNGAVASDGTVEKDLVLSVAKAIQQENKNANLRIVLTRSDDATMTVKDKVDFAVKQKPDAFISLHVNAGTEKSGVEMYTSRNKTDYSARSEALAASLSGNLNGVYASTSQLKRLNRGIWVLDAPEVSYPALLIELGSMSNAKDISLIKDQNSKRELATRVLRALEEFAQTDKAK